MSSSTTFLVPLATSSCTVQPNNFWNAVLIYHDRSHLVNRKLAAVSSVLFYQIKYNENKIKNVYELFLKSSILYEARKLKDISKENIKIDFLKSLIEYYDNNVEFIKTSIEDFKHAYNGIYISLRILFPRIKNANKCIEIVILNKDKNTATFIAAQENSKINVAVPFPYQIELTPTLNNLRINVNNFEDADTSQAAWLVDNLFDKLIKWAEDIPENNKQIIKSLSLIEEELYCLTYDNLKKKYGENLVSQWPETAGTDPQKYVFEDLAIASYLICLWKKNEMDNVKFVDCGCGNGLLVYVLNMEGFEGYGLDIRKRDVWNSFPEDVQSNLKIGTVSPNSTFPDSTWLIGNHSDELTPWIPVLALRSSPITNFFVLPCCPYDFSGQKYMRKNSGISVYSEYLSYIDDISKKSGFDTSIDKLRIPSTRRTCLVGIRKNTSDDEFNRINKNVSELIESRINEQKGGFVPRSDTEKVRNCTQIDKQIIVNIVKICVDKLLSKECFVNNWNRGGTCKVPELIQAIPKENLQELKKECGGLLTLLKNHRYIFEISNEGVRLRMPVKLADETKYKNKPCWFLVNHPNGCLYESNICGYNHEIIK